MWIRLEPGARKCLLTWITEGVKTPEGTDEQGEMVRLNEAGEVTEESCTADQLFSLSEASERMDSLEEASVESRSPESAGLNMSSDPGVLFAQQPKLTSTCLEVW